MATIESLIAISLVAALQLFLGLFDHSLTLILRKGFQFSGFRVLSPDLGRSVERL